MRTSGGYLSIDIIASLALFALILTVSLPSLTAYGSALAMKRKALGINHRLEHLILEAAAKNNPVQYDLIREIRPPFSLSETTHQLVHFYPGGVCSPASFKISNGRDSCSFSVSLRCRINSDCNL